MKTIDSFFKEINNKDIKRFNSQRAELIETIISRINKERVGTKWKPLSPIAVAIKLKGVKTGRLVGFVKECSDSKSFGACFFGQLKKKLSTGSGSEEKGE